MWDDTTRRDLVKGLAATSLVGLAGCLGEADSEEGFPASNREIEILVPFDEGGGSDWYARAPGPYVEENLPNNPDVLVVNETGGGGVTAMNQAFAAEPDGYTLLSTTHTSMITNRIGLPDETEYEPLDFEPVTIAASSDIMLFRHSDAEAPGSLSEFGEMMKSEPIVVPAGSNQVFMAMPGSLSGEYSPDEVNWVTTGGSGDQMAAFDRGEGVIGTGGADTVIGYVDELPIEPVACWSLERADAFPDVPTVSEAWDDVDEDLAQDFDAAMGFERIVVAPPETPDEILSTLEDAFMSAFENEDFLAEAEETNRPIAPSNREESTEKLSNSWNLYNEHSETVKDILG